MILAWVASGPVREQEPTIYRQEIAPHSSKLVWYRFREKLPDVSPTGSAPAKQRPRIELKLSTQEIVTGAAKSPRARQFIWQPAPKLELKQELRSPNVLALHAPHVDPPPQPRLFVPPPDTPKPLKAAAALAVPPELQAAAISAQSPLRPNLAAPSRPKPKEFVLPEASKKTPEAPRQIAAPPEVRLARDVGSTAGIGNVLGLRPARPQPRTFVAPRAGQGGSTPAPALPAPPAVQSAANLGNARSPVGVERARPARRTFVPPTGGPSRGAGKPSALGPPLSDAPALSASTLNADVSVAIVGLAPNANIPVPLPEGSRNAHFSAGPAPRDSGGTEGAGEGGMLFVPGLTVRNGTRDPQPTLMARAAPTSQENLQAAVRDRVPDPIPSEANAAATPVSAAPDPMLEGRAIYAMTVQMPNVTSYTGSWMIWFAERERQSGQSAGVSAPVPLRKVDPKYIASAVEDRIEGKVRLAAVIRRDGRVDSIKLLRHLDDRLDRSAEEAMNKWEFEPALRNGKPVDVDAVIEIPFRLAPKVPR